MKTGRLSDNSQKRP